MLAIVVDNMEGDAATLATRAVEVLGGTAYDVRASMNVPGGGPAVLTVVGDPDRADQLSQALTERGFHVRIVGVRDVPEFFEVRRFALAEGALEVEDRTGNSLSIPYASVEVMVRASAVKTTVGTKTVRVRKFSPTRSMLSGGLVNTKVQETKKATRSTDSDELLFLYQGAGAPLRLSEQVLQYQGLGTAMQPSRIANFLYTAAQLKLRCPQARFDDRLRKRAVQTQMLGRTLGADEHVEFAVSLVAGSLLRGA